MKLAGLSRQIALAMMALVFGITLFVMLTSWAFYYVWKIYWPDSFPSEDWAVPTGPEWAWIVSTLLTCMALAAFVAVGLSRRILVPLNSVTDGIRRVAQGDLNARAVSGDRSLGEAAHLADDFNLLAGKLQRMTEEQTFWNAAIAHELRTPVTILRGRLQGLAEGVFAPDESQFRSLLTQVEGLSRLIEDLRVVSLAESGHLDLQWQEVDLSAEVEATVDFFGGALSSAGQQPVLDLEMGEARVHCDPMRIRQALLALLENARQHAVPGKVRIQARLEKGWVSLSVEDDGPGVPADVAAHLFTAFRRASTSRSSGRGSGLGLAIVSAISQAHGGQANCNPAGQGTRFTLTWPNRDSRADAT